MIVGAEEREMRIVEPRLVEVDEAGRDAQSGAASSIAETDVGTARFGAGLRIAEIGRLCAAGDAAPLERAEVFARLRHFPAQQRIEDVERAGEFLFGSCRPRRFDRARKSVAAVAFAEETGLRREDAV